MYHKENDENDEIDERQPGHSGRQLSFFEIIKSSEHKQTDRHTESGHNLENK
jgi:hypothetical protein